MLVAIKTFLIVFCFLGFQSWSWLKPYLPIKQKNIVVNLLLGGFNFTAIYYLNIFIQRDLTLPHFVPTQRLPLLLQILLTILTLDLLSYFWHKANHRWSFLWKWHKVHHSEPIIDTSSAFRFSPIEVGISFFIKTALISLLNLPILGLAIFEVLFQALNTFQHSNFHLQLSTEQRLNKLFITPALHRLHHSIKPEHQTQNLATIFSFWDKIFKTHQDNAKDLITQMGL